MACVSPSDTNFPETLSTLKYANRARNIKNKVVINQEFVGSSVQVNQLRSQVARLTMELQALKASKTGAGGLVGNLLGHQEEIDRLKSRIQSMSDDIVRLTAERDTLLMERELSSGDFESSPMIAQYQKTIQDLRNELADTQERLAFSESVRAPLMDAVSGMSPHVSHTISKRRSAGHTKKRRTINGSTTTTTAKNITFKSTRRSKVPHKQSENIKMVSSSEDEDIEAWLKETLGSIQTSESCGLRVDAKHSILNAKSQIDKALKVLDEFKVTEKKNAYLLSQVLTFSVDENTRRYSRLWMRPSSWRWTIHSSSIRWNSLWRPWRINSRSGKQKKLPKERHILTI